MATVTVPPMPHGGPTTASTRRTDVLVGLFFLTATITFSIANSLIVGVLKHADYLTGASGHVNRLATGAALALVEGPATVGIAVLLFPLRAGLPERKSGPRRGGRALGAYGLAAIPPRCFSISRLSLIVRAISFDSSRYQLPSSNWMAG